MVKNLIVRKLLLFAVLLVSACSTPHKYIPTNNTHIYHSNKVYYVVKRGDTIHSIAKKFHLSQNAILSSNSSIKANTLKPGNKIFLPLLRYYFCFYYPGFCKKINICCSIPLSIIPECCSSCPIAAHLRFRTVSIKNTHSKTLP